MLPAIALNLLIGHLVVLAGLPLYLDMIGTVFIAVACGPIAGMVSGGATLLLWSTYKSGMWVWAPVAMGIGLVAGFCARFRLFISPAFSVLAGFFIAVTATFISVPIRMMVAPRTDVGETLLSTPLIEAGREAFGAVLSATFLVDMVDKVTVCLAAWFLLRIIPNNWLAKERRMVENSPGSYHPPALSAVTGYLAMLFLYATFFATMVISPQPLAHDQTAHQAFQAISIPMFQQAASLLSQYGHWIALSLVGIMFLGIANSD